MKKFVKGPLLLPFKSGRSAIVLPMTNCNERFMTRLYSSVGRPTRTEDNRIEIPEQVNFSVL